MASVEVFQTDDRYASPVLKGRYQVLASAIGTTYYVYDLHRADQVRTEAKDIRRFEKKIDALSYLGFTTDEMRYMSLISAQDVEEQTEEIEMAKARVVTETQAKVFAAVEKRIAEKRAKAQASMEKRVAARKAAAPTTKKEALKATEEMDSAIGKKAPKKAAKVIAVPPAPEVRKGRSKSAAGTVAARCRELIREGGREDAEMLAIVRAAFPEKTIAANAIKHYRAHM